MNEGTQAAQDTTISGVDTAGATELTGSTQQAQPETETRQAASDQLLQPRAEAHDKDAATPATETTSEASAGREEKPAAYTEADYADAFALPDGFGANEALMGEFKTLVQEKQLAPDVARKLLEMEVRNQTDRLEAWQRQNEAWQREIQTDGEFGGKNLDRTIKQAEAALNAYDPEGKLLQELAAQGYGNHPGIIRFLARVGGGLKAKEDRVHTERGNAADDRPLRDRLWPDDVMPV